MQTIYSPGAATNISITAQKRLIRPAYAQTQGFPYAAYLDPSLRNSDGSIRVPVSTDTTPLSRSANAFTYDGSIVPGTVMVKNQNSNAVVANGAAGVQPWGLLGQWIGGTFDGLGQNNQISVWMGPDSVYDLLAPAWNDAGLAAKIAAAGAGSQVLLYAGTDGRLSLLTTDGGTAATSSVPVARVIERKSNAALTIQLVI
jgi:hypothetical protein